VSQAGFTAPLRVLLGPGPSDVAPSVLRALSTPTFGHLDPRLVAALDELRAMLRTICATQNEATLAVSGTGTSAMECALVNLIEPGQVVLVAVHGYFGARIAEIAERCGASVIRVEGAWGRASDPERLRAAAHGQHVDLLALVHAETSTGVVQDLAPMRKLADELGAMLAVDAVTSVGCMPVGIDANRVDALWSCSQKGLSCTPGLSPVSFSPRALERIAKRTRKVQSFYLDLQLLLDFWGGAHGYHHTISSNLVCGLHEAARLVIEEGLEARFARHRTQARALAAGLREFGLELLVPEAERLPQLTTVLIPDGVADAQVRGRLLDEFGIEIGGGLGPLKGRIWRIGLMGGGATRRNVLTCLAALKVALAAEGFRVVGDGLEAARASYAAS